MLKIIGFFLVLIIKNQSLINRVKIAVCQIKSTVNLFVIKNKLKSHKGMLCFRL